MKILKSRDKLDISYVPKKVLCRDAEVERVKLLLESGGRVVISGEVGTGKTLIARFVAGDAAYVNCLMKRSERTILEEILSQVKDRNDRRDDPWASLPNDITIILDEIDSIDMNDLKHFLYTLSRAKEAGRDLRYIAIARDAVLLKQLVADNAVWSSFAENCLIHLRKYSKEEMFEILGYRAGEALRRGSYRDDILYLIAQIAHRSEGHMRTGIEILRNSALIAEKRNRKEITPEDVRDVNFDFRVEDLDNLGEYELLLLLSIALVCKDKACACMGEVERSYLVNCECYGIEALPLSSSLAMLEREGYIAVDGEMCWLLLPSHVLIEKLDRIFSECNARRKFF